ncbi:MAG TPA: GNAT family N-acetyltransferase [Nocardioides sp.]|nr:GNAT family N-acetyltransferase [Nocardioides sp.]
MSDLQIVELDPFDTDAFDAFYDVYLAAEQAAGDAGSPWMREEVRVDHQERSARRWIGGFAGMVGGRVVAVGQLSTPLLDNLGSADLAVHVDPGFRRRGLGSTMLAHLQRAARDRGRSLLNAEATWGWSAGSDGAGEPGPDFARSQGFALGLSDVKRLVALPVPEELLAALASEAAPHHAAYTLRSWEGPVPEELLRGWTSLTASLMTEAPTGGLEREPELDDPAVVRESEAMLTKQGRRKYNTVALDGHGTVVAYTDVATTLHEPGKAYQWGTLVRHADRGHRLGLAVKVANLQLLQRERPDLTTLVTYNAEVNSHMVAVNEQLGFAPVARLGEFQKRLA